MLILDKMMETGQLTIQIHTLKMFQCLSII